MNVLAIENRSTNTVAGDRRVGLIAGWGRYPRVVCEALVAQGYEVYCLAIREHAEAELAPLCAGFTWCGVAQLGRARRFFRRHGVRRLTMAGKIHKVNLLRPRGWMALRPDWRGLCRFYRWAVTGTMDGRDDTLLGAIIEEFQLDRIDFLPATDFAPDLLVRAGQLSRRAPTPAEQADIQFGWQLAQEMGRLDVGQSVCVRRRAVLAVEAVEGTDACIRRAGALCGGSAFAVVKVAKPQQDMRFDVPTIGLGTLETMHAAGARVLAIEAGRTILLDAQKVIALADAHGIAIVAQPSAAQELPRADAAVRVA